MTDRFVVVPASYVFLLRDGAGGTEVLLQLRQNTGYMDDHWAAAAAGHVERGETAYDAAHREAAEEIGSPTLDLEFVTAMQRTRHAAPIDERIDFFFTARSLVGRAAHRRAGEVRRAALVPARRAAGSGGAARAGGADGLRSGTTQRRTPRSASEEAAHDDDKDLGPQPEPEIEPGEPNPGGADAVDGADGVDGEFAEPDPVRATWTHDNPAVEDALPDEMKQTEDTATEATEDERGRDRAPSPRRSPRHDRQRRVRRHRVRPGRRPATSGVSSERDGHAGPGQPRPPPASATPAWTRATRTTRRPPEQSPGGAEDNPEGIQPKAALPGAWTRARGD